MLIDWFTTIAQIANFLILVFLLKHFLYGPIVRAMDEREQKIAGRLSDARSAREEAEEKKKQLEEQSLELQEQKKSIIEEARRQAEKELQQNRQDMQRQMQEAKQQWRHDLAKQQQLFLDELSRRSAAQVLLIAERALQDLADQNLQQRMVEVFMKKIKNIETQQREQLRRSLGNEDASVTVSTAFELDDAAKKNLTQAVRDLFDSSIAVEYQHHGELAAGIQVLSGNDVVAWNLKEYLNGLQQEITAVMDRQVNADSADGKSDEAGAAEFSRENREAKAVQDDNSISHDA